MLGRSPDNWVEAIAPFWLRLKETGLQGDLILSRTVGFTVMFVTIRRYILKKTDLTTVTQLELDSIVEEINNQPLKCLSYKTPSEAFNHELQSITN